MTCVYKKLKLIIKIKIKIKTKTIQGQWLQLKMKLFLGYIQHENCCLGKSVEGRKGFFQGGGGQISKFPAGGRTFTHPSIPPEKTLEHSVSLNPLVLPGAITAGLIESFIFPDINIKGKKHQKF